jgi:hypothetical protein
MRKEARRTRNGAGYRKRFCIVIVLLGSSRMAAWRTDLMGCSVTGGENERAVSGGGYNPFTLLAFQQYRLVKFYSEPDGGEHSEGIASVAES